MSCVQSHNRKPDGGDDRADRTRAYEILKPIIPKRTASGKTAGGLQARPIEMVDVDGVAARGIGKNGRLDDGPDANISKRSPNGKTDNTRPEDDGDDRTAAVHPADDQMVIDNEEDDDFPNSFNLYRNKKLISHGMMDVALFSANANQLRYVLESGNGDVVRIVCITLLLISISLQVLVGIGLLLSARYNVTNCNQRKMAFKFGNYVIIGIFLITVVNIFITAFGGPSAIPPVPLIEPRMMNDTEIVL